MKVIIAGGRDFKDYTRLEDVMNRILKGANSVVIVSGGADGADYLGESYAYEYGFPVVKFPADWELLGKAAGPIRNRKMAKYADAAVIFWDGKSKGTKSMIDEASKIGLFHTIIKY